MMLVFTSRARAIISPPGKGVSAHLEAASIQIRKSI